MVSIHQFPVTTKHSKTRRRFTEWWIEEGASYEFCGIYNQGKYLYIQWTVPPGSFIRSPEGLWHFPFRSSTVIRNGLAIIHRGHTAPLMQQSDVRVTVVSGIEHADFLLAPGRMAYALKTREGLEVSIGFMPMSACLLMKQSV
jgi:hypothetical protein